MSEREQSGVFEAAWWRWILRGVISALPSGYLAVLAGYSSAPELAAMVVGTVLVSIAVAWALARVGHWHAKCGAALTQAMAIAVLIKSASVLVGAAVLVLAGDTSGRWMWLVVPFVLPLGLDFATGNVVVRSVELLGARFGEVANAAADSFGWTLLATLLQAGAVVGGLLGLAGLILVGRAGVRFARR